MCCSPTIYLLYCKCKHLGCFSMWLLRIVHLRTFLIVFFGALDHAWSYYIMRYTTQQKVVLPILFSWTTRLCQYFVIINLFKFSNILEVLSCHIALFSNTVIYHRFICLLAIWYYLLWSARVSYLHRSPKSRVPWL